MADCFQSVGGVSPHQTERQGEEPQVSPKTSQPLWAESHFPYSAHDNRSSLLTSIHVFDGGLGRRKYVGDRRQQNSNFCLCHMNVPGPAAEVTSTYQTNFLSKQEVEATRSRRFPRSHQERSSVASNQLQQQDPFLWFSRHDAPHTHTPLHVLAAINNPLMSHTDTHRH
ncbi:hypothetical protein AALO_G00229700 [Alosa alosa]|uniref:Domain of unknown function with conserved HDNR motif domain-containing protein n=1 Tax=Alosa alosa TaxID=278164 RepID=A0AAV6FTZ5_9TELE|nr:testis-expressed protein 36 [Alosa alosa]KAG5266323.1 hypothetical protein AALO_G00229700 [Alosa alosa]